jgi:hypothetical protein
MQALANKVTHFPPKSLIKDLQQMGHVDVNINSLMPILQNIPIVADANPKVIKLMGEVPIGDKESDVDKKIKASASRQINKDFK